MRLAGAAAMAAGSIADQRARAALTVLGVVIGVMAVIVMVGLAQAAEASITAQVRGLGAGVLLVTPGSPKAQLPFGPPGIYTAQTLVAADARALAALPGVARVAPSTLLRTRFTAGRRSAAGAAVGTTEQVQAIRNLALAEGRFFTAGEAGAGARVVVLGRGLADKLFPGAPAVGAKVALAERRFRVVGVLADQGSGMLGSNDQAFVPARAMRAILGGVDRVNVVVVQAAAAARPPAVQAAVRDLLRRRHRIRPDEDDDFKLQTQADLLKTLDAIGGTFTALLAGIAAISLLVGGIGIMNIMLVAVTERTREIGVRMALGARRRDVLAQFLFESAGLGLAGGCAGIALGLAVTWGVTAAAGLPFVFSPAAALGGAAFSLAVGVGFGLYPANKAAGLQPVDALRYE